MIVPGVLCRMASLVIGVFDDCASLVPFFAPKYRRTRPPRGDGLQYHPQADMISKEQRLRATQT